MTELHDRCAALIEELGLAQASEVTDVVPLTGGVASDIARVDAGGISYVVKFALSKLKVAAEWHAPVHRNAAEYAWLKVAADVSPEAAVKLYGRSEGDHGFAMEFLAGESVYLWKDALLAEAPVQGEAAEVGDLLGRIHAISAKPDFDTSAFHNRDDFRALRIEPYLTFTAGKHPDVAGQLTTLADMLFDSQQVLAHGDVSPKNILLRPTGPVLLDAECATMGDASFDPSFCLNHLVIKAIHLPASRAALLAEVSAFWAAYRAHVDWETPDDLQQRICQLLPALMLARVDGKSPVEYLSPTTQDILCAVALQLISQPPATLADFVNRLSQLLKEQNA